MNNQIREYHPFRGPYDPCPPIGVKTYVVPPNQFIAFQPMNLPQFPLAEALRAGTLWPALYSPYQPRYPRGNP
ncbi:spore coat associated protein CotJA [Paenibacillus sp. 1P07SE]|uniref:spore coat associated protein CotJA n=1 Tax=Paenibacillus sp. 1P07SE TaxID=3132209 RepID=UPI0039A6EEFD